MAKLLKIKTEELLLCCLSSYSWIDQALYAYSDRLLDIIGETSKSTKDLEALVRLISTYTTYLNPTLCSKNFEWTQQAKIDELEKIKVFLECELSKEFKKVPFCSNQRIKSLESFMEKIWRKGSTPSKAESDLKDLIAFRFILAGRTAEEYVYECYLFIDSIINHLMYNYDFKPIPGIVKATEGFDMSNFDPEFVHIPKKIPKGMKHLSIIKDYIRNPKINGYQGLQISLYSPKRNLYVEVQVKTQIMFENAEFFESSHCDSYKAIQGLAGIEHKLFDNYDLRNLNNLHGFHSRNGKNFIDNLGLIVPRSF